MTVPLIAIFLIFFVGGPLIFRALTRQEPSAYSMRRLVTLSAIFVAAGLMVRFTLFQYWGHNLWVTAMGLLLLWGAWIGVLAFVTLALRQSDPGARMRRWTAIIGALCTTVPWFGLASATLMQG